MVSFALLVVEGSTPLVSRVDDLLLRMWSLYIWEEMENCAYMHRIKFIGATTT